MKYKKKPVIVDVEHFTEENKDRAFNFVRCNVQAEFDVEGSPIMKIDTLEGVMTARLGDYIIKGVHGELLKMMEQHQPLYIKQVTYMRLMVKYQILLLAINLIIFY